MEGGGVPRVHVEQDKIGKRPADIDTHGVTTCHFMISLYAEIARSVFEAA
jgi:hypothetical protein